MAFLHLRMVWRCGLLLALLLSGMDLSAWPQSLDSIPPYVPRRAVTGRIEVWGSPDDTKLLQSWEHGFQRLQRGVTFVNKMRGPDSTMAGIYTGVAQIAFLSREVWPVEMMAYQWVYRFKPSSVEIMTAGLKNDRVSSSLVVIVNKANPIAAMSLTQLDGIFGAEHLRGAANIRTWSGAGVGGAWSARPVHAYGPATDSAPAYFFDQTVLKNSRMWNCDLKELGGERDPELAKVAAAVASDPDGIGYAVERVLPPGVKVLALSDRDGGGAVAATNKSVRTRSYLLARPLSLYFTRRPGTPLDPKTAEFLLYVLSRQGQRDIVRDGAYEPLTGPLDATQRAEVK